MSTFHDDPRITAYILDELTPEEREAFEADLKTNPELRAEVNAMAGAADVARDALGDTPKATLSDSQRDAILTTAQTRRSWSMRPLAAAAAVLLTVGLGVFAAVSINQLRPDASFDLATAPERAETAAPGLPVQPVAVEQVPAHLQEQLDALGYSDGRARPQPSVEPELAPPPAEPVVSPSEIATLEALGYSDGSVSPPPPAPSLERSDRDAWPHRRAQTADGAGSGEAAVQQRVEYETGDIRFGAPSPAPVTDERSWHHGTSVVHPAPPQFHYPGGESYDAITDNPFFRVLEAPLSTFSIDVDTASYSVMRRFITQGQRPPRDAVRIEELINYFDYDYPAPDGGEVLSAHIEATAAPWNEAHRLVRIGIKGQEIEAGEQPPMNLVFLVDVSGSMGPENRLPLVQRSLKLLVNRLRPQDRVGIVVYASQVGVHLPSTPGTQAETIRQAIDQLRAQGSTNAGDGIQQAYRMAEEHFIPGGVNRVILCTDGDFNVGITDRDELTAMVEGKAKSGVFLTVLGFGMGNLKDGMLEHLSNKGNGSYAYIDTEAEARKVFVHEMTGTLVTIAQDVKIQVEFNPAHVEAYRLIGYENRKLAAEDFLDDTKDAGEIGAGHTVTALYEVVPRGLTIPGPQIDDLRYQRPGTPPAPPAPPVDIVESDELLTVKVRYQPVGGGASIPREWPFVDDGRHWRHASPDTRWAASVAAFGMILRESPHKGSANLDGVIQWARNAIGADTHGYREEFVTLAEQHRARHGQR